MLLNANPYSVPKAKSMLLIHHGAHTCIHRTKTLGANSAVAVSDNSAVVISSNQHWLHNPSRNKAETILKALALPAKKDCSQLMIQRFVASPAEQAEIMVPNMLFRLLIWQLHQILLT